MQKVVCQVCRTGFHEMVFLRKRLDDTTFEWLLFARERAKVSKAVSAFVELLSEPSDTE